MRLSLVFHAFLARMAVGSLAALVGVMAMRAAERHVRFMLVLSFALFAGAAALYLPGLGETHPDWPRGIDAFLSARGGAPGALVVLAFLCLVVNSLYGAYRRTAARVGLVATTALGVVAVLGTARLAPGEGAGIVAARTAGGVLGGLLMGGVDDAMILGHFYLMIRGLPLEALKRTGVYCIAVVAARVVGFGLVLAAWPGAWDLLLGPQYVIWTCWRVAFGFVGPAALVWMTRDALAYRHTQAATGILYVAVFFALMGELAAVWLESHTGLPV